AASLKDITLQYGPEERAINFTGNAALTFGDHPHADATISALQIDVDRVLAAPDVTNRPPLLVIGAFVDDLTAAVKPPLPGDIHLSIDGLTLGGTPLQSLRSDIHIGPGGWTVQSFECRAPGLTQVQMSGRLERTAQGAKFSGPGTLASTDVDAFLAWLGGSGAEVSTETRGFTARGDLTIADGRVAVDRLVATLDQNSVAGRLAYTSPADDRPAKIDGDLHATELDLDALSAFAKAASGANQVALPREGSLAIDIGKAKLGGVDLQAVKGQIKYDADNLQIDRLSIGALGGAAVDIAGRVEALASRPRGQVNLDLDARSLAGLADLLARFSPPAASGLRLFADKLAPAKLHAVLNVAPAGTSATLAKLDGSGTAGALRVAVNGEGTGQASQLGDAALRIETKLDADDGSTLAALFGLDRIAAVDRKPGQVTLSAKGPLKGDIRIDARLIVAGLDAALRGAVRFTGEHNPAGALQILASAADLRPLRQTMTGQAGALLPVSARAQVTLAGSTVSLSDLAVALGKGAARGRVSLNLATPLGIDGNVEADDADAAGVAAVLFGLPSAAVNAAPNAPNASNAANAGPNTNAAAMWSNAPVGGGAFFPTLHGTVGFKFARAIFTPALIVSRLGGVAHFDGSDIALSDLDGEFGGGHIGGEVAFHHDADALTAHARLGLTEADAAALTGGKGLTGRVSAKLQADGIGRTPADLVGGLHGNGSLALADGAFLGIDAAAFDAALRVADQSGGLDAAKVETVVSGAMANGHFAVPRGEAALTISGGQINAVNNSLQGPNDAALALNGVLDLNRVTLDTRLLLSVPPPRRALIDNRPQLAVNVKGPLGAPDRRLDVSALTGWLALHSAELQTRHIEMIEAERHNEPAPPATHAEIPELRLPVPGA
ncbi:MAG: hypothetical protein JO258_09575, partial [Alphaproteobacteria bacterium]|nr:hypothetical protein [Alphaproteobacteria bacterium]